MSRRQAFGVLTNHSSQQQQLQQGTLIETLPTYNNNNATATHNQVFKQQTTTTTITAITNGDNKFVAKTNGFGFKIYCDENSLDKENQYGNTNQQATACLQNKEEPMILDVSLRDEMKIDDSYVGDNDDNEEEDDDDDNEEEIDDEECLKQRASEQRDLILSTCTEYAEDILIHLKELELKNRPKATYLKQQQDINSSMRAILVDWLVEVAEEYKLHTETLYLAVNYTDRFLSKMSVLRGKLQLLGTAAMYIASKYEEIYPPDVNEFVYITDDTYNKQQVLRMEHLILKALNFHMNAPTANCFLLHFTRFAKCDQKCEYLARYLSELTLVDAEPFLDYVPSVIASSALYLSMMALDSKWSQQMCSLTGYTKLDLKKCVQDMYKSWSSAQTHAQQAIQDKYRQERFMYVACMDLPELRFD